MTLPGIASPIVISGVSAVAVLGAGGLLTRLGPWYEALRKPRWQPPDWLFGPAWTLIGALAACSAAVAWTGAATWPERIWLVALFALNGVLNMLWSLLFFTLRRPDWALREVVFLAISIAAIMADVAARTPLATWLMVPYLAWVTFASFLNLTIVRLNPHKRTARP